MQKIYDESGLKPWIVTELLQRIKSYGSEEDYRIALATLIQTNHGVTYTAESLAALHDIDPRLYSRILKCVQAWGYDLYWSRQRLTKLTASLLVSPTCGDWMPRTTSPDIAHIHRESLVFILAALEANNYSFDSVKADIWRIIRVHVELEILPLREHSADVFCSFVLMRFWERNSYNTRGTISTLKGISTKVLQIVDLNTYNFSLRVSALAMICHLLHRFSYQLDLMSLSPGCIGAAIYGWGVRGTPHSDSMFDALTILVHARHSLDIESLVAALAHLTEKFISTQGYLFRLAHHHQYDIRRLVELEKIIEDAYPPEDVKTGVCWNVFEKNGYDLHLTLQDAAARTLGHNEGCHFGLGQSSLAHSYTYTIQDGDITWNVETSSRMLHHCTSDSYM